MSDECDLDVHKNASDVKTAADTPLQEAAEVERQAADLVEMTEEIISKYVGAQEVTGGGPICSRGPAGPLVGGVIGEIREHIADTKRHLQELRKQINRL